MKSQSAEIQALIESIKINALSIEATMSGSVYVGRMVKIRSLIRVQSEQIYRLEVAVEESNKKKVGLTWLRRIGGRL